MSPVGADEPHKPIAHDASASELSSVVTMLRAPRQRLISAFYDAAHPSASGELLSVAGCSTGFGSTTLWEGACNAATYARAPCTQNAMTAMITGCYADPTKARERSNSSHCLSGDAAKVHEASLRVRSFGFIGLLEDFNTSARLFHAKYGQQAVDSELEPGHTSSTASDKLKDLPAGCSFISKW